MTAALDRATALHADPQLQAFLHVIGAGESNETLNEDAYRAITLEVGGKLAEWAHPWYGQTTMHVGHSTACGAFGFLGTSWKECSDALGLGNEFTPLNQRLAAIWTIDVKRHAIAQVLAGDMAGAIAKLRDEWVSLPGLGLKRMQDVFARYGGVLAGAQTAPAVSPAPQPMPMPTPQPSPQQGAPMGAIALPLLQSLLPSVLALFSGRAQATIAEKTGSDPQLAQQFFQGFIQQIAGAVGMPQVKSDAEAIQAVGELHKQIEEQKTQAAAQSAAQTALVKKLEADSLDYLHDLTQAMKDVVEVRKAEVQIETDSANAAASRTDAGQVRERIDHKVWWAYGIGAAVLGSIAIAELWITKIVDGQIVGALILAFGALGGAIITMVNYGYGSSGSSGAKDVLIGEMVRRQAKDK